MEHAPASAARRPRTYVVLSTQAWTQLRHEYADLGLTAEELGARYGVHPQTIRDRASREGWTKTAAAADRPLPPPIVLPASGRLTLAREDAPADGRGAGFAGARTRYRREPVLSDNPGPDLSLRCNQQPPPDPWSTWALLGGRGAGKTLAGARWLRDRAFAGTPEQQAERRLALVGPTLHDVREVMVCGPSGLLNLPGPRPDWRPSRRRLEWPNGCVAYAFSAEEPERLRGPQFEAAWLDEFCTYRRPDETLSLLRMGLRLGEDPRLVVTTTPRPNAAFRRLLAEPSTTGVHVATAENADNLAPGFLQNLHALYGGTRLERQELGGELLADADGALWRRQDLDLCRADRPDRLEKVVVAVDPPAGSGSPNGSGAACGIVVAGRLHGRAYVLADRTVHGLTPDGWARAVADAARAYGAQAIVAETNQGGDMVKSVLQTAAPPCAIRKVTASASKRVRAEPVAALYEQRRVFHCAAFPALEEELLSLGAAEGSRGKSPDRADALVWAVTDLLLSQTAEGPRARWG